MTLSKFYFFIKDFNLLSEDVPKERVSLLFTKRCPSKLMDFAAFVDVLYKLSKYGTQEKDKHERFRKYLEDKLLSRHMQIIDQANQRHSRVSVFGNEY